MKIWSIFGWFSLEKSEKSQKKSKKVDLGRSSKIDLRSGRQKSTSTDRLRPTANTTSQPKIFEIFFASFLRFEQFYII